MAGIAVSDLPVPFLSDNWTINIGADYELNAPHGNVEEPGAPFWGIELGIEF